MKVLVIQGPSITPGVTTQELIDRWAQLSKVDNLTYDVIQLPHPATFEVYDKVLEDYDALIGMWITKEVFTEELFLRHPKLKYVATTSHGFEQFDVAMTHRLGITVTNTIYGDVTIAQYAMALLLEICHHVRIHSDYLENDYFENENAPFTIALTRQIELANKTIGVIGLGSIGYKFAKMANGFGANVIAYDPFKKEGPEYDFIEQVPLDELLKHSDIISIHCPLTKDTYQIINKDSIDKMKDGVILINTARGKLIDENALLEALNSNKIYAAGLDVLVDEPPVKRSLLIDHPNCIVTGHVAWLTAESRLRSIDIAVDNYINYLNGIPTSVINK